MPAERYIPRHAAPSRARRRRPHRLRRVAVSMVAAGLVVLTLSNVR